VEDVPIAGYIQVERDRELVSVARQVIGAFPFSVEGGPPPPRFVAQTWPLDLDDVGTKIA
jgi:hypothetical protein